MSQIAGWGRACAVRAAGVCFTLALSDSEEAKSLHEVRLSDSRTPWRGETSEGARSLLAADERAGRHRICDFISLKSLAVVVHGALVTTTMA